MDTRTFLDTVLPVGGWLCAVAIRNKKTKQFFYDDNRDAVASIQNIDARGIETYFACATFKTKGSRKKDNVLHAQALWMDIDVGDNKGYSTRREAVSALADFISVTQLPSPLVISSGRGFHLYWLLAEPATPDEWQPVADMLKRACIALDFKADPSRTADMASILRPTGTKNRKNPASVGDVVRLGTTNIPRLPLSAYLDLLSHVTLVEQGLGNLPNHLTPRSLNDDLSGGLEYPTAQANMLADNCAVIGEIRKTKGNVEEPLWYNALGVLKNTEEAPEICHEWSTGHPDYTRAETDKKLAQLESEIGDAVVRCDVLAGHRPELCNACPHFKNHASPITMGWVVEKHEEVDVVEDGGMMKTVKVAKIQGFRSTSKGGRWLTETMVEPAKGDEPAQWATMANTKIEGIARIDKSGAGFDIEFRSQHEAGGPTRDWLVPGGILNAGGTDLLKLVGEQEIFIEGTMKPRLETYLKRWAERMKADKEPIVAYNNFGWQGDKSFVLGDKRYTPDGKVEHTILTTPAKNYEEDYVAIGEYDMWKYAIKRAYSAPGGEALQFMLLCGFAAPLLKLFNAFGGVTVFAFSEGSGHGKTTAQEAALSVWGNPEKLSNQDGQTTLNALWNTVGAHNNLPVIIDELTNKHPEEASRLIYTVSGGKDRQRLTITGEKRKGTPNWSTILLASGNVSLTERLSQHRANVQAELSRLFEIYVPPVTGLNVDEASEVIGIMKDNYGHAGIEMAQYMAKNRDSVEAMLEHTRKQVMMKFNIKHKERYWAALFACILTSYAIARKLSILQFDDRALMKWMKDQLDTNRGLSVDVLQDSEEIVSAMLNNILDGMLVTVGSGDVRTQNYARVLHEPRSELKGRVILSGTTKDRDMIYVPHYIVKDWCSRDGVAVSATRVSKEGKAGGWLVADNKRVRLGQGTEKYTTHSGQVRCWAIDPLRFGAAGTRFIEKAQLVEEA